MTIDIADRIPPFIELKGIPLPPSVNKAYKTVSARGRVFRAKSQEMRHWEKAMAEWAMKNVHILNKCRDRMSMDLKPGVAIEIQAHFYFKHERVFCKNGKPKRMDTSNYLKPLHDAVAQYIGVDDCWFFDGSFTKHSSDSERVDVVIELFAI